MLMIALVEKELDRFVTEGTIEPVQSAYRAACIVPLVKQDKVSDRICGDFKLTNYQASKLDIYSIPRIEDLLQNWQVANSSHTLI